MDTGSVSKVRLVKCPKCMRLLPEEEGLAIYKCGGCGTFLQAKIRRKPDVVHSSEQDNVSQGQGSSSTTRNQTLEEALKNNLVVPDTGQLDAINIPEEVSPLPRSESYVIVAQKHEVHSTETGSNLGNSGPSGNSPKGDEPAIEDDESGLGAFPSHQPVEKSTLGDEELVRAREILRKGKFPINSNNHYSKKCKMRDPNEPSRDEHRKKEEDREKLKLLRRVYELQNQLDKTHFAREKAKQNSKHCNPEPCFDERYQDLNCPAQGRFSGEVINRKRQVDHSCLHCCPHHCQCKVHCHPTNCCCYGPCCIHHHHNLCDVHCSRPRSDEKTDKERYTNTWYHSQNLHASSTSVPMEAREKRVLFEHYPHG